MEGERTKEVEDLKTQISELQSNIESERERMMSLLSDSENVKKSEVEMVEQINSLTSGRVQTYVLHV